MLKLISHIIIFLYCSNVGFSSEIGIASWYGRENRISSVGKKIQHYTPALAHKTLPIGCFVKITNLKTNTSVIAIVEDRGPYTKNRIADLNIPAAKILNIQKTGLARVKLEQIKN
jgi:rare lipoprotein A